MPYTQRELYPWIPGAAVYRCHTLDFLASVSHKPPNKSPLIRFYIFSVVSVSLENPVTHQEKNELRARERTNVGLILYTGKKKKKK